MGEIVVLTFELVDLIPKCDHKATEHFFPVGAVHYVVQGGSSLQMTIFKCDHLL